MAGQYSRTLPHHFGRDGARHSMALVNYRTKVRLLAWRVDCFVKLRRIGANCFEVVD